MENASIVVLDYRQDENCIQFKNVFQFRHRNEDIRNKPALSCSLDIIYSIFKVYLIVIYMTLFTLENHQI